MSEVQVIDPTERSEIVLERLSDLSKKVVDDFCEMSELLYEAWEYQYHKKLGYDSFQDYAEQQLDMKGRKAHFLVHICKTLKRLKISWDEVREIGWRKTATISPILDYANKDRWIEEAKTTNLNHLAEKVKAERKGNDEPVEAPIKMTLQLDQDEQTIVQAALDYAKRYENASSNSKAIVRICYDYFQNKEESI